MGALGKMTPELVQFQCLRFLRSPLLARGGTMDLTGCMRFLRGYALLADTIQPVLSKLTIQR